MAKREKDTVPAEEQGRLDAYRKLEQERLQLREEIEQQLMQEVNERIATLQELGFTWKVVDETALARKAARTPRSNNSGPASRPCVVCQFHTDPQHDARKHRYQGDAKLPFTADDLARLGMRRL
jgi:hypothetical protein